MTHTAPPGVMALQPRIQHYAWGDDSFIPGLLGRPVTGEPWAEAWFGAHASAPSSILHEEAEIPLDALLAEQGLELLGRDVHARYGGLPFLVKLLAAARPLSIQVHPDALQAQLGYARENADGVPLDARERNYRDGSHKPELIVALTEFDALCGFRPPQELTDALLQLPELRALLPELVATPAGLEQFFEAYFALPSATLEPALVRLLARLESEQPAAGTPGAWALAAQHALGASARPDRGLLFVFLLALVRLAPGQGMFLHAGVPHAYLQGCGIEVMASSDNVLRAGLTPKHVDAGELMRVVRFDAGPPTLLMPPLDATRTFVRYPTRASEFELGCVALANDRRLERVAHGPEILLFLGEGGADATATVRHADGQLALGGGDACFVAHGTRYAISGSGGSAYVCSVPG